MAMIPDWSLQKDCKHAKVAMLSFFQQKALPLSSAFNLDTLPILDGLNLVTLPLPEGHNLESLPGFQK